MNIRIPETLQTVPAAVADFPGRWQRATLRSRLIWGLLGLVALLILIWILVRIFTPAPVTKTPPAPVNIAQAIRKTVTVSEHTNGTVIANATVQVTSRVEGQLVSAAFKEGQMVDKGDLLFQLDPRPFQAALEQAAGTLARDQASLVSDQHDAVRYKTLAASGAASAQQRDQAVATAKAMAATVVSDKAALDAARLNLSYAKIYSPVDGKTGPILIQPGNLVTADSTNALVVITQIQPVKVSFFLPQTDLPQIQARMGQHNMSATVQVDGQGGKMLTAPVDFLGNTVDNKTGTIELRATYPNADLALVPGALVNVAVTLSQIDNATVVPHEAVNVGPDSSYLYVVTPQMTAKMVDVTSLYDDGTEAAVKGDVKAGDKVVTEGQLRLVPGIKVVVKKTAAGSSTQVPEGAQ